MTFRPPLIRRAHLTADHTAQKGTMGSPMVLLTAIVVAAAPFVQTDWPNPRGPIPAQDGVVTKNFLIQLPNTVPFVQSDWPNPKGPVWRETGFVGSKSIVLPVAANPTIAQLDYPNPRGYQPLNVGFRQSESLALTVVQPIPPHINYDQPNPVLGIWSPNRFGFSVTPGPGSIPAPAAFTVTLTATEAPDIASITVTFRPLWLAATKQDETWTPAVIQSETWTKE